MIIPSLDEGAWLERTVRSVLDNAPDEPFEVLVLDDGSSDGSADFLTQGLPGVRLLRDFPTRQGLARIKNHGARAARGSVLLFLDAHSTVPAGGISRQLAALRGMDNRALVGLALRGLSPIDGQPLPDVLGTAMRFNRRLDMEWTFLLPGQQSPILSGSGMMVARSFFEELDGFDPGILEWGIENIELSVKAHLIGRGCRVLPRDCYGHVFKPIFQYPVTAWKFQYAKLRAAHILFPKPLRERIVAELPAKGGARARAKLTEDAESITERRAHLQALQQRSIEQYLEFCSIEI